jgi:C_GCAxxG_C_C family probable redox protein
MILPQKYRNLSREQLLQKAYDLGVSFEKYSGSCSQCTVAALREILGFEEIIVQVASSSCGGQAGLSTGACGGVIGGTIVLDYYLGRPANMVSATQPVPQGMESFSRAMEAARLLCNKFIQQYASILCPQVQEKIFGRAFNHQNPADWQAFLDAGAHTDPTKCMSVVGNAAQWTLEILLESNAALH